MSVQLAPSILSADFAHLGARIEAAERGGADLIHVDVMDGHFVPNITIGPPVVQSLKRVATRPLDVHLMIEDPDRYLDAFAEAGASMDVGPRRSAAPSPSHDHAIKALGVKAGVVLNPSTPVVGARGNRRRRRLRARDVGEPGLRGTDFHPAQRQNPRGPRAARSRRAIPRQSRSTAASTCTPSAPGRCRRRRASSSPATPIFGRAAIPERAARALASAATARSRAVGRR